MVIVKLQVDLEKTLRIVKEQTYLENAEKGDAPSQIELAMYYYLCEEKDKAVHFLRKAAENESGWGKNAKFYLAYILVNANTATETEKEN